MSCGLARGRRSNPVASLKILELYGTPVLMSGLASLVMSAKELSLVDQQLKRTIQNIIKLPNSSPTALVYFISGTLPGTAILHLRQLTLFGMVCRLPRDPLHQLACHALLSSTSQSSWFVKIRDLLLKYQLPHPLLLLKSPPQKDVYKKLLKSKVIDYWEKKLRLEASLLPSMVYVHTQYMSLTVPHRIWTTAGSNPHEVAKARVQLLFLSSQYPCGKLTRHWSKENPLGLCSHQPCHTQMLVESPEHILLTCPAYTSTRLRMITLCLRVTNPVSHSLVMGFLLTNSTQYLMQFLLDCTGNSEVIKMVQLHGDAIYNDLFYLSRTWCFALHRERLKRMCKWNYH